MKTLALQEMLRLLQSLDERALQQNVIEPLLYAKGFQHVRDNSGGSLEKGKDLVATKRESFGRDLLYAIQIKRQKYTGKRASKVGIGNLLSQLRQALTEEVVDPVSGRRVRPDRCIFFSPYALDLHALETSFSEYQELQQRGTLTMVDGLMLASEVIEHRPDLVATLTPKSRYLAKFSAEVQRIPEAKVAFELTKDLSLNDIYVEVSVLGGTEIIRSLMSTRLSDTPGVVLTSKPQLSGLREFLDEHTQGGQYIWIPPRKDAKTAQLVKSLEERREKEGLAEYCCAEVRISPVMEMLHQATESELHALREAISAPLTDISRLESALLKLRLCAERFETLSAIPLARQSAQWSRREHTELQLPAIRPPILLDFTQPVFVVGVPGVGKTTLMRSLSSLAATIPDGAIPVLVSLAELERPDLNYLLRNISENLKPWSDEKSLGTIQSAILRGQLLLMLDGLDEMGSGSNAMLEVVDNLVSQDTRARVIISCRSTVGIQWRKAFAVEVPRFSDSQLDAFIDKWFTTSPSTAHALKENLRKRKTLQQISVVPLYAALICSLFDVQRELPQTELELYDRRLDLLLGKWEVAKGVKPATERVRTWIRHVLICLAFKLHSEEKRFFSSTEFFGMSRDEKLFPPFLWPPEATLTELVKRGLITGFPDQCSFGHLTFQEHLTALYLAQHNDVEHILSLMGKPWWQEVLVLYARQKGDITSLLRKAASGHLQRRNLWPQLWQLTKQAPLTNIYWRNQAETWSKSTRQRRDRPH